MNHMTRLAAGAAATALLLPVLPLSVASAAPALRPGTAAAPMSTFGEVTLPAGLRPEGITSGPGQTFYVGSLADGRILVGDLRSGSVETLLPGAEGRQIRGLYHDARSGLVWAAGNVGTEGHVWAIDSRTGEVVADVVVPGSVFLNDLVVDGDAVYVTDSRVDRLTVIALESNGQPTGDAPTYVELTGEWPGYDGTNIAANGIRALPDGSLVLNNSGAGGLWQVDPQTGDTTEIPVSGGTLVGGDGLELRGLTLFDVRGADNASVAVLSLRRAGDGWTATFRNTLTDPRLDVPSTATLIGNTLWAVNARFGVADPGSAGYWVTPLRVG